MVMCMKISKKWLKMAEMYKRFATDFPSADFSRKSAEDMFIFESKGIQLLKGHNNGFAFGKKWMDVTLAMWKEDIEKGNLFIEELLHDNYPKWFLKKSGILHNKEGREMEETRKKVPVDKRCEFKTRELGFYFEEKICIKCGVVICLEPEDEIHFNREEEYTMCESHKIDQSTN